MYCKLNIREKKFIIGMLLRKIWKKEISNANNTGYRFKKW